MKILVAILFSFLSSLSLAQGILEGIVVDEQNDPQIGASISLRGKRTGTVSNASGKFRIVNLQPGKYQIDVSFISFATQSIPFEIIRDETVHLEVKLKEGRIQLADVTISASDDRPVNTLSQIDMKLRPVNTSQDILRMVPGLFIAQHAGGGKAEQIFLRGFDADHGTDVAIDVDGMPVNMVSHAHGQGYADLHFLIPELVSYVDFDKGPYFANKGDFNTAGYVSFNTKNRLDQNFAKLEGGSFGAARVVAGVNLPIKSNKTNAYVASEFFRSDGYFISKQRFNRFNFQSKLNHKFNNRTLLTAALTAFDSHWNASGQVPTRAVDSGLIGRYGSLDPTEGGSTGRFNAYVKIIRQLRNGGSLENQVYAVKYNFSLFSNFTFFLKDTVNGDQIHQQEKRLVYGYKTQYNNTGLFLGKGLKTEIGAGFRYDVIDNIALSHTIRRSFLNDIKRGDVREANLNGFISETLSITDRLSVNAALRFDYLHFSYNDKLNSLQPNASGKAVFSPKLNIQYQASDNIQVFVRSGSGFHSNDARVVVAQSGSEILPKAYGIDVGTDIKVTPQLFVHAALWRLDLDQEFVYVGDEGIVEPSGKTRRAGIDLSVRQQLTSWLFVDGDLNMTNPRFKSASAGENYVPLAPTITSIGGLTIQQSNGFSGSLRYRYLGNRAANEDNSVVAKGYTIADAIVNYARPGFEVGVSVENLFNTKWNEAQFDTESRLKNEAQPVSEIHFTPGTPFSVRLRMVKYF